METEIFWNAVRGNDARFDGAFVYAVRTTGIYCKASCSSRTPKRENVAFFEDFNAAELSGFRACQRCLPKNEKPSAEIERVLRICEMLEEDPAPTLAEISDEIGLSPTHLQKVFKELIGVSPKKFAEMKRLERFREGIKSGVGVTDAMYDAGFGSSSRLYENVSEKLGMTPRAYAAKGKHMKIAFTIAECDLGNLLVARTEKGVCSVAFGDSVEILEQKLKSEYANAEIFRDDRELKTAVAAILGNIEGRNKSLDLPVDVRATAFQMRVWEELRKIPYGETLSYSDVAKRIGKPNSVRAVATACASNRVALVIPCHRVVGKNGALSGYRWGIERKRELLERESS